MEQEVKPVCMLARNGTYSSWNVFFHLFDFLLRSYLVNLDLQQASMTKSLRVSDKENGPLLS